MDIEHLERPFPVYLPMPVDDERSAPRLSVGAAMRCRLAGMRVSRAMSVRRSLLRASLRLKGIRFGRTVAGLLRPPVARALLAFMLRGCWNRSFKRALAKRSAQEALGG
ncbi:hypothetical protein [Glycomyces sp. NPDC048151]|uniref:hypothetical protein n=1 Tax=Glycomyces sp. NPDC048151 TaxID=3364002 RepID=UPI003720C4C2